MEAPEMRGGENWGFKSIHAHPPPCLGCLLQRNSWLLPDEWVSVECNLHTQTLRNLGFGLSEETGGDTRSISAFRVFLILGE